MARKNGTSTSWSDRNLTRIELVMALLVIALLIGTFTNYMLSIFAQAERSMMKSTIVNINTALHYRGAMAVMKGKHEDLEFLLTMNPFEDIKTSQEVNNFTDQINSYASVLAKDTLFSPINYGGILLTEDTDLMEKGKWYYQQDKHLIIYTISNTEFFESDAEGLARIHFRVELDYEDNNENGQYDINIDEFNSVKFLAKDNYIWDL